MRFSWLLIAFIIFLTACTTTRNASVEDRRIQKIRDQTHRVNGELVKTVRPGDTLYSIAFAWGLNVKDIAAWNGIRDSSKISVGQRLRLSPPKGYKRSVAASKSTRTASKKSTKKSSKRTNRKVATGNTAQNNKPGNQTAPKKATPSRHWHWPVRGRVVKWFTTNNERQGIDIKPSTISNVLAASAGKVVYVGNGLKGYGNLIIIKHDDTFLSAYANNDETYVSEGQKVTAKQRIAKIGGVQNANQAFHFQIREHGNPVNPLNYLPKS